MFVFYAKWYIDKMGLGRTRDLIARTFIRFVCLFVMWNGAQQQQQKKYYDHHFLSLCHSCYPKSVQILNLFVRKLVHTAVWYSIAIDKINTRLSNRKWMFSVRMALQFVCEKSVRKLKPNATCACLLCRNWERRGRRGRRNNTNHTVARTH